MARAYQCDRCMRYYTENKDVVPRNRQTDAIAVGITINTKSSVKDKPIELCDDCLKEFLGWLYIKNN